MAKSKRGRPSKLVRQVFDHWPVEAVESLPDGLRGVYVLYDPQRRPIRVGISGRGRDDVKRRLGYYTSRKAWRHVHFFSVFTFTTEPWFKQVEVLILRAVGRGLAGNKNLGRFPVTTTEWLPPRKSYKPERFLKRNVKADGTIRLPTKYRGRSVRVEVGAHADDE